MRFVQNGLSLIQFMLKITNFSPAASFSVTMALKPVKNGSISAKIVIFRLR